jgi:hypothetical protein
MFTDFEVISCYTRADAIRDGVLVDITSLYPITKRLYKYPVAFTESIWNVIETTEHENLTGIVLKILVASQRDIVKHLDEASHLFSVVLGGAAPHENWTFKIQIHGGDHHEPVITVMQKNED